MSTFVHISDLHFGREVPKVLASLLEQITRIRPDIIIISGDLTQRAKHSEFCIAKDFLEQLEYPYLIVPGNHDITTFRVFERFFYPWKKWRQYISTELEPASHTDEFVVVGVNTARRFGWYLDWSRGRISPSQTQRVMHELEQTPDSSLRLLVAHHPFWLPAAYEYRHLIGRRDQALQALQQAGVDIILSGHIHLTYSKLKQGVIISHSGTTISNRLIPHHPNSFNVIRGNRVELSLQCMEFDGVKFQPTKLSHFVRSDSGWQQT
ncbi:MAG: Metallophosphoesterase [uncultured Thiotrichaceae bacterium]|uniref:Metallophosphoesterase n=1 Tax=uncultured Thiotrichaceae bacterium TaxID=298394 RepID=A0A6S6SFY1_9GAMM|nr:MAG: Metallophosphoesterase [uncultured Thiotrichaceae bacterium]